MKVENSGTGCTNEEKLLRSNVLMCESENEMLTRYSSVPYPPISRHHVRITILV